MPEDRKNQGRDERKRSQPSPQHMPQKQPKRPPAELDPDADPDSGQVTHERDDDDEITQRSNRPERPEDEP